MVYKLLKGWRKLYEDLRGREEMKKIYIFFQTLFVLKKITGINLYFLIYFLAP